MDDVEKFGGEFHKLSFGEAIRRELLTDYQLLIIGVDNDIYRQWVENRQLITVDGKEVKDAAWVAGQIAWRRRCGSTAYMGSLRITRA